MYRYVFCTHFQNACFMIFAYPTAHLWHHSHPTYITPQRHKLFFIFH